MKNARHLGIFWKKTLQSFCACRAKRLSTLYQTRENVTKRRACHAKRHSNLFWNILKPSKVRGLASSPRHVGASKRAFCARHLQFFTLCSSKFDVFQRVFSWNPKSTTWKPMFRGRRSSIFSACHKTPRLPRNLHIVATWRSTDNAIRKNHITWHVWSAAPATQNEDGGLQIAALATKHGSHALKTMRKYRACHTEWLLARYETCWNVTKRHACHAKLRYATSETSQSD